MNRLHAAWLRTRDSLWFIPVVMVIVSTSAAFALVELDLWWGDDLARRWPRLFGAGAEGARSMLAAIATSMVTVAGVVFSSTIVVLSLAASQYSPRVLRHFMGDRPTQVVLGAFVSIFAYCLIVLRATRDPHQGDFVPAAAVLGGVLMAFFGVALLIYFVHHVAQSIQVSSILRRVARETAQAIDESLVRRPGPDHAQHENREDLPARWHPVRSPSTGFIVRMDDRGLLDLAQSEDSIVRVVPQVGGFVIEGRTLAFVGGAVEPSQRTRQALQRCFTIDRQRTVYQDPCFGLQQIVDVALKALSPGIHDPTTATLCVNHLCALLYRIADRELAGRYRFRDGRLRVIAGMPDFDGMVALSLDAIILHSDNHAEVLAAVCDCIEVLCEAVRDPARLPVLARKLSVVSARASQVDLPAETRHALLARGDVLRRRVGRRIA